MARPLPLARVADRFGMSASWMRKNIARLQAEHGFPRCIDGFPNIYDPVAIEGWLARQRATAAPEPVVEPPIAEPPARDPRAHWSDAQWGEFMDRRAVTLFETKGNA